MAGFNGVALPTAWAGKSASVTRLLTSIGVHFQEAPTLGTLFPPFRDLMVLAGGTLETTGVGAITALVSMALPIIVALFLPNTQQIMVRERPVLMPNGGTLAAPGLSLLTWRKNVLWAASIGAFAAYASFGGAGVSQFLYFNF
jgi:hypothetical protein